MMNRFIKSLFYYNSDDEDTDVSNNTKINTSGGGGGSGGSGGINTNITYTIPPYQYNRIYAYPRAYK
jgi:hypothetical protein